jgi:hypothetical protein
MIFNVKNVETAGLVKRRDNDAEKKAMKDD